MDISPIVSSLKKDGKKIVVCGGCFDILHIGHIKFLSEAKKMGDILIVLLESDERVKALKGVNRPIFSQEERAEVLTHLKSVDIVIKLPVMHTDTEYAKLMNTLKPHIIALTEHDPNTSKKMTQAESIGAKVLSVPHIHTYSSSKLAQMLGIE